MALAAALLTLSMPAARAGIVATYPLTGAAAPDGNGQFLYVRAPVLNNAGQLSFIATLTGTVGGSTSNDRFGVFRSNADGTITQIARGLQPAPGGLGVFNNSFGETTYLNDVGDVAFTPTGSNVPGIYRGDPLIKIVRPNDAAPDGNGVVSSRTMGGMNNAGQISYVASLGAPAPTTSNQAVYRSNGTLTTKIAREGDAAPGGGQFTTFGTTTPINEAGQVGFFATAGGNTGVFRGDGTTTTLLAKAGQPAPGPTGAGDGVYGTITAPTSLNDKGEAVFIAKLSGTSAPAATGLFRSDGTSGVRLFAQGQPAPNASGGTTGVFQSWERAMINNRGEVIAWAGLSGTPGGPTDNRGLFISDGVNIRQVMRNGDPAPDGNGQLQSIGRNSVINDSGQTVFQANLVNQIPGTGGGLYFFDPEDGLITIARMGQPLLGSRITSSSLGDLILDISLNSMETSALNEAGQVAFQFRLANNLQGFAIWSPPTSDFNDDGHVDRQDLLRWTAGFGDSPATAFDGDADGDQDADGADFLTWQRNLGSITTAAVPEPAHLALIAIASTGWIRRASRNSSNEMEPVTWRSARKARR